MGRTRPIRGLEMEGVGERHSFKQISGQVCAADRTSRATQDAEDHTPSTRAGGSISVSHQPYSNQHAARR